MTTKEKVLEELNLNKGNSVSGEQLAEKCGVSRAAIWKAVTSLREEGFQISGTTKGGYILEINSDCVNNQLFQSYFTKNFPEINNLQVHCFKEIDSTNSYAKRLLSENQKLNNVVIVAEQQTAGRGRLGRTFYSPSKTGIYLSIIVSPEEGITKPARITAFSAVAVCRAINKIYGIKSNIKWINDIFVNGKKAGGILTEGFTSFESGIIESAIIGIGINITENSEEMPEEIKNIAGTILSEQIENNHTPIKMQRCDLAAAISGEVLKILSEDPDKVMEEYKSLSFLIGQELQVYPIIGNEKASYKAIAFDIDDEANLLVKLEDGSIKALSSGEVSLKSSNFSFHTN